MAQKVRLACRGLANDPSPLVTGDAGGLRIASNVVIEAEGAIAPRPNFYFYQGGGAGTQRPRSFHDFAGTYTVSDWDGASTWSIYVPGVGTLTGSGDAPLDPTRSYVQFAEARNNLYWCVDSGVKKTCANTAAAVLDAGMHEANSGEIASSASGTLAVLPTAAATAYRWCFRKIDANGVITRSAPSPWQKIANSSGLTINTNVLVQFPDYVAAGDQIELYRTYYVTPETATPSDMLYQVTVHTVTGGDVSTGYKVIFDDVPDDNLGTELYTNPTREGYLKGNGRPPACVALAQWQGCMWYGNTVGPWTCVMTLNNVSGLTSTATDTGIQRLSVGTLTTAIGDPTITGYASTTNIVAGQMVTGGGTPGTAANGIPAGALVLSKTANTVTMTVNATALNAGTLTAYHHDHVTVDGLAYWASAVTTSAASSYPTFAVSASNPPYTASQLAMSVAIQSGMVALAIEDPYARRNAYGVSASGTVVFREQALDDSIFTVTTSRPAAFTYEVNTSGGILVQRDVRPHGVMYSKPDEPEHVPEINWITLGNERSPILAFAPLRNALLVFKQDGIYRITGSAPDNFSVDVVEPALKLVRGDAVSVVGAVAYAWCEDGVYEVDEGGARDLSTGFVGRELATYAQEASRVTSKGAWLSCWPLHDLVLLGVPDAAGGTEKVFCYCTTTGAWSTWDATWWCAAATPASIYHSFFVFRGGAYWQGWADRALYGSHAGYDTSYAISAWTYTAATPSVLVTLAQRGTWNPAVNDWVSATVGAATEWRKVTAVATNGTDKTCTLASAFSGTPTTDFVGYEAVTSVVQWQAATPGSPAVSATWREIQVSLDWSDFVTLAGTGLESATALVGATSSNSATLATETWSKTRSALPTLEARIMSPRAHARAAHLYPYVSISDIGLEWRIAGCSLVFEPTSERTAR